MTLNRTLYKKIFFLALPVSIQALSQSLLGMADILMVRSLGSTAVASVGLAAKLHFLMMVFMMGIAFGCGTLIAQFYGARNYDKCRHQLAVSLVTGSILIAPCFILFCFGKAWLSFINPDSAVVILTSEYLLITAPVLILTQWVVVYESGLRSQSNTFIPLVISLLAVFINIGLNYILIFGNMGAPALGVIGAAIATLISKCLHMLFISLWVFYTKHSFHLSQKDFQLALSFTEIRKFLLFTMPLIINQAVWGLGNSIYHIGMGYAGTNALAVMGLIVPIESALFSFFFGLSSAASILIGQSLGAEDEHRARYFAHFFDKTAIILCFIFCLTLWVLRYDIAGVYADMSLEVESFFIHTLSVMAILMWMKVNNMIRILGVLRAGADNTFCLTVDTVAMWVFAIPIFLVSVLILKLSFPVLFILIYMEDTLKWFPVWRRFRSKKWMNTLVS